MKTYQVSVIVPVYNVEKYIDDCLHSLEEQTLKDIEVIIVDDCGTDSSMKIAENYASRDARFKIIHHTENRGLSSARNSGIKASSAPLLLFVDSDDAVEPDYCLKMVSSIKDNNTDIAMCGTIVFYDKIRTKYSKNNKYWNIHNNKSEFITEEIIINTSVVVWNKIFKRDIIINNNLLFPDGLYNEDHFWWRIYCLYAKKISWVNEALYWYRQHPQSIMAKISSKQSEHCTEILDVAFAYYDEVIKRKKWQAREDALDFLLDAFYTALKRAPSDRQAQLHEKINNFIRLKNLTPYDFPYYQRRLFDLIRSSGLSRTRRIMGKCIFIEDDYKYQKIKLFGHIPLWTTRYKNKKKLGRLFGFLSIISLSKKNSKYFLNILGLIHIKNHFTDKNKVMTRLGNALFEQTLALHSITSLDIDDTVLLSELHKVEPFTFIPDPGNCGDMLLSKATLDFFDKHQLRYELWDGKKVLPNIVYGGGGIWIPNYRNVWSRQFLPLFAQAAHVTILPSSFHDCPELIAAVDERFVIFCREEKSFAYMKDSTHNAKVLLDHDMAFRATDNILREYCPTLTPVMAHALQKAFSIPSYHTVHMMRTDSEAVASRHSDLDLSNLFGSSLPTREEALFGAKLMLATVSRYEEIHTDRLHVAIAAALIGKRVHMIDNNYGKLSGVYARSMTNLKKVSLKK